MKTWFQNRRMKEKRQFKDAEYQMAQVHAQAHAYGQIDAALHPAAFHHVPLPYTTHSSFGTGFLGAGPHGIPVPHTTMGAMPTYPHAPLFSMPDIRSPFTRPVPLPLSLATANPCSPGVLPHQYPYPSGSFPGFVNTLPIRPPHYPVLS